jgi:uncharacterized protein (TIGR02145 family)
MAVLTTCNKDENKVTHVTLNKNSLTLAVDGVETLIATVFPKNATNKTVRWESSDLDIATVADGKINAKEVGTTTISVTTQEGNFTATCEVTVTSTEPEEKGIIINGIKWATRNLAARGKFVENSEDYGALFQWGRKGDGHEQRTSPNYPTNDISNENGVVSSSYLDANGQIVRTHAAYGKFIKQEDTPFDWCAPQKDALWNSGSSTTPIKTSNDPCPVGWRVPTHTELAILMISGSEWDELNGVSGRFFDDGESKLFLPAAGARWNAKGEVSHTGSDGYYWCSTVNSIDFSSYLLHLNGEHNTHIGMSYRAAGFSVRCVVEH